MNAQSESTCPYCHRVWGSLQRMPPWDEERSRYADIPTFYDAVLERRRFDFRQVIPALYGAVASNSRFTMEEISQVYPDMENIKQQMLIRMMHEVYSQDLDHVEVEYPATWWQHFKQWLFKAWAPYHWPWFADFGPERWPVKTIKVVMDAMALYPKIAVSDQAHCIRIYKR